MRALTLFNATFPDQDNVLWILIYEDPGFNRYADSLYDLFEPEQFDGFYNEPEHVTTRYFVNDKAGNSIPKKKKERIIIGRLDVRSIKAEKILTGIANYEMGFKPAISQRIIFLDPETDRAFFMYDDRGCYVWSNNANAIRNIYEKYTDWIVPYNKPEIDEYFK